MSSKAIEIKRILLIDDEYKTFEDEVRTSFDGIEIIFSETKDEAIQKLNSNIHFDAIILDWFLEEESSILSKLVLRNLYDKLFVPVFIWSHHISEYDKELADGEINYPQVLVRPISKDVISTEMINKEIETWLNGCLSAKIGDIYRKRITDSLEKAFFELARLSEKDITSILGVLVGTKENIDSSNDFILNLIHRKLISDKDFINQLKELFVSTEAISDSTDIDKKPRIVNKFLYYCSNSENIRCGDIVKFKNSSSVKYGIIVTPDCDLAQNRTRFLEIIELVKLDDASCSINAETKRQIKEKNNQDSYYFFPSLEVEQGNFEHFVALLKSKSVIECMDYDSTIKYPAVKKEPSYSSKYRVNNEEIELIHICAKSNPYKSDFLQKLHSHNSRVGTPNIKNLLAQ